MAKNTSIPIEDQLATALALIETLNAQIAALQAAKQQQDDDELVISDKISRGLTREQAIAVIQRQRDFDAGKAAAAKAEADAKAAATATAPETTK